jgi:hypothetical protein
MPAPAPASKRTPAPTPPAKRPPTRQPARTPTGRFTPAAAAARCSIKLAKRPPLGRFVATADSGNRIVARSPAFKLKRDDDDSGLSPPDALRTLVEELAAAGWRKTGAGRAPWELRFERQLEGAVTRHASPPRA